MLAQSDDGDRKVLTPLLIEFQISVLNKMKLSLRYMAVLQLSIPENILMSVHKTVIVIQACPMIADVGQLPIKLHRID